MKMNENNLKAFNCIVRDKVPWFFFHYRLCLLESTHIKMSIDSFVKDSLVIQLIYRETRLILSKKDKIGIYIQTNFFF